MPNYLEDLYSALRSEFGIMIQTNDRERYRAKLYATRRDAFDPALDGLSIVFSPTAADELWIIQNAQTQRSGAADQGDPQLVPK